MLMTSTPVVPTRTVESPISQIVGSAGLAFWSSLIFDAFSTTRAASSFADGVCADVLSMPTKQERIPRRE